MKLYGSFTSPFVRHCRLALIETGTPHEFVEANYDDSARLSPIQKVPFLRSENIELNDSASIVKYIREQAGQSFCSDAEAFDMFCVTNTVLDASVNLFLLEKEGITPADSNYLQRQANRVKTGLRALETEATDPELDWHDGSIRLAGVTEWLDYRQRIDLTAYPALRAWLAKAREHRSFVETAPPAQ